MYQSSVLISAIYAICARLAMDLSLEAIPSYLQFWDTEAGKPLCGATAVSWTSIQVAVGSLVEGCDHTSRISRDEMASRWRLTRTIWIDDRHI